MKLVELQRANDYTLTTPTVLYRVQRRRSRPGSVAVGELRVAPRGLLLNRFDLPDDEVAYFSDSAETAIYETLARRDATKLSADDVGRRALLTVNITAALQLLDLRLHAGTWPVLQSLRYAENQELALGARDRGYSGLIYRSSQQYGADCIALFGPAMRHHKLLLKVALADASGALHRAAAQAIRGSKITFGG